MPANAPNPPAEVLKIRAEIRAFFSRPDANGQRLGPQCGVYAFFDYDGEPIYVGQTVDSLSSRVGRHLTGRRTDAVGKFVLDPFEVLEIEVWPEYDARALPRAEKVHWMNRLEFAVFQKLLAESQFSAVLNEGVIRTEEPLTLPKSYRGRIIPDDLYEERKHRDIRIARRAMTIASLARLISERMVGKELRTTLLVQSQRLQALAQARLDEFADVAPGTELADERNGEDEPPA
jgi:hypothetical protein